MTTEGLQMRPETRKAKVRRHDRLRRNIEALVREYKELHEELHGHGLDFDLKCQTEGEGQ